MDTFSSSDDPLDREIASKEAEIAKAQATIAEAESQIKAMRQEVDLLSIEVRALRRAATLRPSSGAAAPQHQPMARPMALAPEPVPPPPIQQTPSGRFRDVVDQIRASR